MLSRLFTTEFSLEYPNFFAVAGGVDGCDCDCNVVIGFVCSSTFTSTFPTDFDRGASFDPVGSVEVLEGGITVADTSTFGGFAMALSQTEFGKVEEGICGAAALGFVIGGGTLFI